MIPFARLTFILTLTTTLSTASLARAELVPVDSVRSPAAEKTPNTAAYADSPACARMQLAALYAAQKAHESERGTFAETFLEMGYEPAAGLCDKAWLLSLRAFNDGKEFRGEAMHPRTGEIWTINQSNKLTKERAAR